MTKLRLLPIVVLLATSVAAADRPAQRHFAGVWQATFKDKVFMTLKLDVDDNIAGSLSGGSVSVNQEGDIIQAEGGGKELPISNAEVEGGKLMFDWQDEDGETAKLVMKIVGDGEAELQFSNLPEGAKMKPIRLRRS